VFCGAKQAPAPAVQPSVAKTAFGYSANEVMAQLGRPATAPAAPSAQSGLSGTARPDAPTQMAPTVPPQPAPYTPPAQSVGAPQAPYNPPPQQQAPAGAFAPYGAPPAGAGMGIHSPPQPTPAPLPTAAPPYLASKTGVRAGRPIEPWKDSLKLWMIVWGVIAVGAFCIPLALDPIAFNWDAILHGAGKEKIPPLSWAGIGVLSIAIGALPMVSVGRGIIAAILGLAGIAVPFVLAGGTPPWQALALLIGTLLLIPGLLVRDEYVESLLARIMVTLGVLAVLAPFLVPQHGQIPLVGLFKGLIEAPGAMKVTFILEIAQVVIVVLCLLAWMPGPATGGAKVFAWILIMFPAIAFLTLALVGGDIGGVITKMPGKLFTWVPDALYSVLAGYGLATVIGKQLE
jgi:hypothetical protein